MKLSIQAGSTSQTINVFIRDSTSTTGAGKTGLAYNTASLTAYYMLPRATPVAITLATQTVTGAYSSGGFVELDATHTPGWYRLDIPDAAVASGRFVDLHLRGATGMADCPVEIELTAWNNQSATIDSNVVQISGDSTAADNLEAQFDGSGLTGDTYPARQDQVSNIAVTGSPINAAAVSYVLTTGTQSSGTYLNTATVDNVMHEHTDTAGTLDLYYQFNIGPSGIPSGLKFVGRINGSNDPITIYAYNWAASSWDVIAGVVGTNASTNSSSAIDLLTRHVGSGANVGLVRIRFAATGLTTATLRVDQLIVGYATVNRQSDSLMIAGGTTFQLSMAYDNILFTSYQRWTLDLNGQSVDNCFFANAYVGGVATGTNPVFTNCMIETSTLPSCEIYSSGMTGTITLGSSGLYEFVRCFDAQAGAGAPTIDFDLLGGASLSMRDYRGAVLLENMAAGDSFSIDGMGRVGIGASCTGGTVRIRGNFDLTNAGAVTVIDTARFNESQSMASITGSVGSVVGNVGGNVAGSVDSVTQPVTVTGLSIPTVNEIADGLLDRSVMGGSDGDNTVGEALGFLRNTWSVSGTTLTVYEPDGTTPWWTGTVTTNASADPITGVSSS